MIKKILLAEDDQDDMELFSEALNGIDPTIELMAAGNGKELIHILQVEDVKPQLIFIDINMPEMNGWECLDSIKMQQDIKDIPVIMYSTSSSDEYRRRAIQAGAVGFYEKPVSYLQLVEFLKRIIIDSPQSLQETLRAMQVSSLHKVFAG